MEESEGSKSTLKGKVTVTSPIVLAAILDTDKQDVHGFDIELKAVSSRNASRTANGELGSLDLPLRDSLESTEMENADSGQDIDGDKSSSSGLKREFSSSNSPLSKPPKAHRTPKPPRPQHIVKRNKGNLGKRVPGRSYAQMHAIKAKTKESNAPKVHENTKEELDENLSDTPMGRRIENVQKWHSDDHYNGKFKDRDGLGKDLDYTQQNSHRSNLSFEGHQDISLDQESILFSNNYLESTNNAYQNHGSPISGNYWNKNARPSFNNAEFTYAKQLPYAYKLESHNAGYYSALRDLHQSHAVTKDALQDYGNQLSTQSAPPEIYGNRRTHVTNTFHCQDQDLSSSVLSFDHERSPSGRDKIPESTLSRKFSSEPYLTYSNSPMLHKVPNTGTNSKTSGSYSSLRQPFEYKPYTLKDYRNFMGARVEQLAGSLGPNVDTDDFKGKMEKVSKQREYAAMLRAQHASMRKQPLGKELRPPAKPPKLKEADIKRQAALNYAKNVPKPKQVASRGQHHRNRAGRNIGEKMQEEKDVTVLELLKMRHEREKNEVDAIRKELASKLRL